MEIEKDHQLPHLKSTHQKKEAKSAMQIYFSARLQSVKVSAASRVVFSGAHCQSGQLCNLIVTTVTQPPLTPACSRAHYAVVAFQQLQAKRQITHRANMPLCRIYAAFLHNISAQVSSLLSGLHSYQKVTAEKLVSFASFGRGQG